MLASAIDVLNIIARLLMGPDGRKQYQPESMVRAVLGMTAQQGDSSAFESPEDFERARQAIINGENNGGQT